MDTLAVIASLLCPTTSLVTLGYLAVCSVSPFGPCRHCHGTGKQRFRIGRRRHECRPCDGTGRRIRIGTHIVNRIRAEYRRGNR
ncbi:hypothetical protein [Micromonospora sp. NPDC004704]